MLEDGGDCVDDVDGDGDGDRGGSGGSGGISVGDGDGDSDVVGIVVVGIVVVRAVSVLPKPPSFLMVLSRDLRTWNAGVAAFSKMSCAILSPSLMMNLWGLELTKMAFTSPPEIRVDNTCCCVNMFM